MRAVTSRGFNRAIPKQRQRHHSYDESVDEPAKVIEEEAVDVEDAVPLEDNEPVEGADEDSDTEPSVFEE
jgi:hypothetical protein